MLAKLASKRGFAAATKEWVSSDSLVNLCVGSPKVLSDWKWRPGRKGDDEILGQRCRERKRLSD